VWAYAFSFPQSKTLLYPPHKVKTGPPGDTAKTPAEKAAEAGAAAVAIAQA
jgi:hypothetical protein